MNKYISYSNLDEIIKALRPGKIGNNQTYVSKNYSKEMLINDLIKINNKSQVSIGDYTGS